MRGRPICEGPRTTTRTWARNAHARTYTQKRTLSDRRVLISALAARSGAAAPQPICVLPRGAGDEGSGLGRQRRSSLLMAHKLCACAGCHLAPFHLDARPLGSQESRTTPQPRPASTGPTPPRSPPPPWPPLSVVAAHTSSTRSHDDALLARLLGLLRRHKHHTNGLVEDVLETLLR